MVVFEIYEPWIIGREDILNREFGITLCNETAMG
jgi:hypothetical protein